MTANELFSRLRKVIWMLTDGSIPVTVNGNIVEITDVTLEGSNGNYWCDIKVDNQDLDLVKRIVRLALEKPDIELEFYENEWKSLKEFSRE